MQCSRKELTRTKGIFHTGKGPTIIPTHSEKQVHTSSIMRGAETQEHLLLCGARKPSKIWAVAHSEHSGLNPYYHLEVGRPHTPCITSTSQHSSTTPRVIADYMHAFSAVVGPTSAPTRPPASPTTPPAGTRTPPHWPLTTTTPSCCCCCCCCIPLSPATTTTATAAATTTTPAATTTPRLAWLVWGALQTWHPLKVHFAQGSGLNGWGFRQPHANKPCLGLLHQLLLAPAQGLQLACRSHNSQQQQQQQQRGQC